MTYLITGIVYFIIVYLLYYIFIYLVQKKKKFRRFTADVQILRDYYKLNIKKIGYKKVYRSLNFVNALLITFLAMVIINIKNIIIKLLLVLILVLPVIWFGYYLLAMYLKKEENKKDDEIKRNRK